MSYDGRFYWEDGTPKDLDTLKASYILDVKQQTGYYLSQTDWYIIRRSEHNTAIPVNIEEERAEIRNYCDTKESAINACEDIDSFVDYVTGADFSRWPDAEDPLKAT